MKTWDYLYSPENRIVEDAELRYIFQDTAVEQEVVDLMLSSRATLSIFVHTLSYHPGNDVLVLYLARADDWITACTVLRTLQDGKSGKQNTQFKEKFRARLIKALQQLFKNTKTITAS